jgi:hypothetical protein
MKMINTLQHALTADQLAELKALGYDEVVHLRDLNPELFAGMANTPGNEAEVGLLAFKLMGEMVTFGGRLCDACLLPLGSPALMFSFARMLGRETVDVESSWVPDFFFAHSERVSEDQPQLDGTVKKVVVFKHIRFLKF